jgi:hypothetical protein
MLVAKRCRVKAAFALNRLDDDRGDIAGCDIGLEQVIQPL